jgi:hypothetical protein
LNPVRKSCTTCFLGQLALEHDPENACPWACPEGGCWFSEKLMLKQLASRRTLIPL